MIDTKTFSELHELAMTIAPELRAQPLYLMAHPAELPMHASVLAYAVSRRCPPLWGELQSRSLWLGAGPIVAFVRDDLPPASVLEVFIHELGHVLPATPINDEPATKEEYTACESEMRVFASVPIDGADTPSPPWYPSHGGEFIRRVLHLWWRAAFAGVFVDFTGIAGGPSHGLAPLICYWRALADEPMRMKHATFAEIEATKPPAEFLETWNADSRRWSRPASDLLTAAAAA